MSYKVDNAVIMAAGTSSRFAPLSYEIHKALITVRGEILIERQIRQLKDAGVKDIYVVTGYKNEQFEYLKNKLGVKLIHNSEYLVRNNNSSIHAAEDILNNSYICSSDNYFLINPFETIVDESYYSALYAEGHTDEWCMDEGADGFISRVVIGGEDKWYMLGHAFWSEKFTRKFLSILDDIYNKPETAGLLWESIFMQHLDELKMRIRKYPSSSIFEFDILDELRSFDESYVNETRSKIIKSIAKELACRESDIVNAKAVKHLNEAVGFSFTFGNRKYKYTYSDRRLSEEE